MEIGVKSARLYHEVRDEIDFYRGKLITIVEWKTGMILKRKSFMYSFKKNLKLHFLNIIEKIYYLCYQMD